MILSFFGWFLQYNLALVSSIAGFLSEEVLLFFIILSGVGVTNLWIVALFGFIGIIVHDSVFYFFACSNIIKKLNTKIKFSENNKGIVLFIEKLGNGGYFKPLLLSKFIYGTRVPLIFYAAHREKNFGKFILYNILTVLCWFLIMAPIGWLAGQGFSKLLRVVRGIEKVLAVILILAIIVYAVRKLVNRGIKTEKLVENEFGFRD